MIKEMIKIFTILLILIPVIFLSGKYVLFDFPVTSTSRFICPQSGMTKFVTVNYRINKTVQIYHKEYFGRLEKLNLINSPKWLYYGTTTEFVAGKMYACGDVPIIFRLSPLIESFAKSATDSEIIQFNKMVSLQKGIKRDRQLKDKLSDYLFNWFSK